ncbi:MAG: hypothetical protein ACK5WO_07295, partial [Cyclobacteriaceae bacterium]
VKELNYFSNLQHSDGFVGHTFSFKKAEGMLQIRVAQYMPECQLRFPKKTQKVGSLSSRMAAHFRPESVAQFSPE